MSDTNWKCHLFEADIVYEMINKAFPEDVRLRFTDRYNCHLVFCVFFLLGVASITKASSQTVDSGQAEDTRWSEVSSDVEKVRFIFFGNW